MIQFLLGMQHELVGDVHVLCALEDLGIHDVSNDCLVFARKIFVEKLRQTFARDGRCGFSGFSRSHKTSSKNGAGGMGS